MEPNLDESLRVAAQPNLRELVAVKLREAIASGRFAPGQRLVERELCELFGVSRTSVREALREIESEGLLTNVPNRGPIVSIVGMETAESIYQVRAMLEGLAVRLFTQRASEEEIDELDAAVDRLEGVYADYSAGAFLSAKADFYRVLLKGARNEIAADMLRSIHSRVSLLRATSLSDPRRAKASLAEIRAIVQAIRDRDENRAWTSCIVHLENASKIALAVLEQQAATA